MDSMLAIPNRRHRRVSRECIRRRLPRDRHRSRPSTANRTWLVSAHDPDLNDLEIWYDNLDVYPGAALMAPDGTVYGPYARYERHAPRKAALTIWLCLAPAERQR